MSARSRKLSDERIEGSENEYLVVEVFHRTGRGPAYILTARVETEERVTTAACAAYAAAVAAWDLDHAGLPGPANLEQEAQRCFDRDEVGRAAYRAAGGVAIRSFPLLGGASSVLEAAPRFSAKRLATIEVPACVLERVKAEALAKRAESARRDAERAAEWAATKAAGRGA